MIPKSGKTTRRGWDKRRPSPIKVMKHHAMIHLNGGGIALCSLEDVPNLRGHCWRSNGNGYVTTRVWGGNRSKKYYMHRLILGLTRRQDEADHVNFIRWDNRRSNLRLSDHSKNNYRKMAGKSCGVSFSKNNKKWHAYIDCNGKRKNLGHHLTREAAVEARICAEKELFSEVKPRTE